MGPIECRRAGKGVKVQSLSSSWRNSTVLMYRTQFEPSCPNAKAVNLFACMYISNALPKRVGNDAPQVVTKQSEQWMTIDHFAGH